MGSIISKKEIDKETDNEDSDTDDESETLEIQQGDYIDEESQETEIDPSRWLRGCKKDAFMHTENYIPINKLDLDKLPESIRDKTILRYIQLRSQLVVKIKVNYVSMERSDDDKFARLRGTNIAHVATGYAWIHQSDQIVAECPCVPCLENKENMHNVYHGILIITNRHVIFDNEEAKKTEVLFFFDDEKDWKKTVVKGFGISLREDLANKDYVSLKMYCHDESLFQKICEINGEINEIWTEIPDDYKLELKNHAIVISHPHGHLKMVSFGELLEKEAVDSERSRKVTKYTSMTCEGSSGAPVLTGLYWTKPFVHSSGCKMNKRHIGLSFSY